MSNVIRLESEYTHTHTRTHTPREHTVYNRVGATEKENISTFLYAGANSVKSKLLNISNRKPPITFDNDKVVFLLL
jgi:hypothetical protein